MLNISFFAPPSSVRFPQPQPASCSASPSTITSTYYKHHPNSDSIMSSHLKSVPNFSKPGHFGVPLSPSPLDYPYRQFLPLKDYSEESIASCLSSSSSSNSKACRYRTKVRNPSYSLLHPIIHGAPTDECGALEVGEKRQEGYCGIYQ